MTLVVDASLVVAGLIDCGPDGAWAEEILSADDLCGPHLLPVEVANILRRAEIAGDISKDSSVMAHADLLDLSIQLFPYAPFAERIWSLRLNLTAYDAWYVALAETLEAGLGTLDKRLAQAPGVACRFLLPDH